MKFLAWFMTSPLVGALIWTVLCVDSTMLAVSRGGLAYWFCAVVGFGFAVSDWNAYWRDRGSDS